MNPLTDPALLYLLGGVPALLVIASLAGVVPSRMGVTL
jgi:hypothetical protein